MHKFVKFAQETMYSYSVKEQRKEKVIHLMEDVKSLYEESETFFIDSIRRFTNKMDPSHVIVDKRWEHKAYMVFKFQYITDPIILPSEPVDAIPMHLSWELEINNWIDNYINIYTKYYNESRSDSIEIDPCEMKAKYHDLYVALTMFRKCNILHLKSITSKEVFPEFRDHSSIYMKLEKNNMRDNISLYIEYPIL